MYWTIISISPPTMQTEISAMDLPIDGPAAAVAAQKQLPDSTIVALIKGSHVSASHIPVTKPSE